MSCANFQELLAGQGAATATDFTPANIDFPYDSDDELRLDIYNYEDQQWVNVPLATGATIDVGGAGDVFYAWETYLTNGQTGVRTILATAGTTPALPTGGTASHPLVPANNNYPVQGGTGVNVRLYRQTSIEAGEMPAYFYPGASIRAQDLNDNFEALRKVVEESSCGTDNVTNAIPQLDARYWNKLDDTLEAGDAWVSDDAHIATTSAGDARWLNATGGNVIGGDGIDVTEAGGNVTISVDLDDVSGLEFDGGELRIDANSGCEIVAAGLNAETTDASIVQTGGTDADPAIRVATTLGATTTNNDLQITGGANVTVTRNNDNQLTIASAAATGGATFRGTVDVDNNNTLPATTGGQNPNAVNIGDGFTVENNVAAADVTANWNTVLDNWDTGDGIINSGDVILCTTAAAAGSPTDARYNLIRTGGNINTLQQVTDAGNTTTNNIVLDDSTLQIQEGADTLTLSVPALTADRAITFPDAAGEVALAANIPAAPGNGALTITAGTNLTGAVTGGQFTANKADATTITLDVDDVFVLTAGDTMTGNLVMDTANIQGDVNAITAGAGNWNLNNGNFWTLGAVVVPNPTNMEPGLSGLIVNTAAATWPAAGGATFQYAANTPPNITEFPAVIPFYCPNDTTIFIGTPTVNIV